MAEVLGEPVYRARHAQWISLAFGGHLQSRQHRLDSSMVNVLVGPDGSGI